MNDYDDRGKRKMGEDRRQKKKKQPKVVQRHGPVEHATSSSSLNLRRAGVAAGEMTAICCV